MNFPAAAAEAGRGGFAAAGCWDVIIFKINNKSQ